MIALQASKPLQIDVAIRQVPRHHLLRGEVLVGQVQLLLDPHQTACHLLYHPGRAVLATGTGSRRADPAPFWRQATTPATPLPRTKRSPPLHAHGPGVRFFVQDFGGGI